MKDQASKQAALADNRSYAGRIQETTLASMLDVLPDPDPILAKMADGGAAYLNQVMADGVVFSLVETRQGVTLRREWRIEPGEGAGGEVSEASKDLCRRFEADLEQFSDLPDLIAQILDAPLSGPVPVEVGWRAEGAWLRMDRLEALLPDWFGFDGRGEVKFRNESGVLEEPPKERILMVRHKPTMANPYGRRALSRCLWPVLFKKGGLKAWITLAEKLNLPLLIGNYQAGTTPEGQGELMDAMVAAQSSGVLVLPDGTEVKVAEATGRSGAAQIHKELRSVLDREISRIITGSTLAHDQGPNGSRAATETHKEVTQDLQEADQALVRAFFERLAKLYRDLNDRAAEPPRLVWFEEEDPQQIWAERDQTLATGLGVRFSKTYIKGRYGLSDEDFELGPLPEQQNDPAPVIPPNSASFAEVSPEDLFGELPPRLRAAAEWGVAEELRLGAEANRELTQGLNRAKSPADLDDLLAETVGPDFSAGPLAVNLSAAAAQGHLETSTPPLDEGQDA